MRPEVVKVRKGNAKRTPVAVILVSFNGLAVTRKTLRLLRRQTLPHNVILVDNDSSDGTFKALTKEFPEVTIILAKENYGGAGGYFLAQEYAWKEGFEFFVMADNDAHPSSSKVLKVLVDHCRKEPTKCFIPTNLMLKKKKGLLFHYGTIHRSLIEKAGFVDYDYFFRADDYAYSLDLYAAGGDLVILTDVKYTHHLIGMFRSTLPVYFMVRNDLRVKLREGILSFAYYFMLRTMSALIVAFYFCDRNLARAYYLGLSDFVFARYTLERSLSLIKGWCHPMSRSFAKTVSFSKQALRRRRQDTLMTDAIYHYVFGRQVPGVFRFLLPRRELFTTTYGSASLLPSLFARKVNFLKNVEYDKGILEFFVDEHQIPYLFRLFLGLLFLCVAALLLVPAFLLHIMARLVKWRYFREHKNALRPTGS